MKHGQLCSRVPAVTFLLLFSSPSSRRHGKVQARFYYCSRLTTVTVSVRLWMRPNWTQLGLRNERKEDLERARKTFEMWSRCKGLSKCGGFPQTPMTEESKDKGHIHWYIEGTYYIEGTITAAVTSQEDRGSAPSAVSRTKQNSEINGRGP